MDDRVIALEKEIKQIKDRNRKVEANKAWETSSTRKVTIALVTYFLIGFYMTYLGIAKPWLSAFVPTLGYILSTLTLSWFKQIWIDRRIKQN